MNSVLLNTILTATGLAIACALLSVVVVVCRWAFIGEGISHSGFGGAGTAWLLMLIFPSLDQTWMPYLSLVIFCLLTSVGIGLLSRARGVNADAAIGVFLVASLAWGFLCQQIYSHVRHATPVSFDNLLWGRMIVLSAPQAHAALLICAAVILIVVLLAKEILAYSFDPQLAVCSGVRARFIHYLLMLLIAVTIIIGAQLVGTVLVTALLVLPGASALRITRQLTGVVCISIVVALAGTLGGLLLSNTWPFLPPGPVIVLLMLLLFLIALIGTAVRGTHEAA